MQDNHFLQDSGRILQDNQLVATWDKTKSDNKNFFALFYLYFGADVPFYFCETCCILKQY